MEKSGYNLTTTNGSNIYQILKSSLHFACHMASSRIVKYLLVLFKNDKDVEIHSIDNPRVIVDILMKNINKSSRQTQHLKKARYVRHAIDERHATDERHVIHVRKRKKNAATKERKRKRHRKRKRKQKGKGNVTPLMAVIESDPTHTNQLRFNVFQNQDNDDDDENQNENENSDHSKRVLDCFKLLLSHPDIGKSISQIHNGKTIFLHCVENGKKHLVEHMFDATFNFNKNNNNNNSNRDIQVDFKRKFEKKGKEEDCLQIALKTCNMEMVRVLLSNIIKYTVFTNDEIRNMCQNLLRSCIDEKYREDLRVLYNMYDKHEANVFYEIFIYLINDKTLVRDKSSGDRFVDVDDSLIESCIINQRHDFLKYLLETKSQSISLTKNEAKLKRRIEKIIQQNMKVSNEIPPHPGTTHFQDW